LALGCILTEMIGDVQPWPVATPEDKDYSDYLMDGTVLSDRLPNSHTVHAPPKDLLHQAGAASISLSDPRGGAHDGYILPQ
jgi:hypothetical protein